MVMQAVTPDQVGEAVDTVATGASRIVEGLTGLGADVQGKILLSLVVVVAIVALRRVLLRVMDRRVEDVLLRYRWAKGSAYGAFALALILVVQIWFEAVRSMGTFLGLLSAGLAIALRDLVANLAGWVFVVWRRPFELGDRIQIGTHAGDVVDRRIFQFTILEIGNWVHADQSTGRVIHIPNQKVFTEPLANYTAPFEYLWNEVRVLVTFESDWRKAKAILTEIGGRESAGVTEEAERALRKASRQIYIFYQKLTPNVYTEVKESGVQLTLRYLCKPRARRGTAQAIWEGVLEAFEAEDDIELAYPTQRVFFNPVEGKEEARASLPGSPAAGGAHPASGPGRAGGPWDPDTPPDPPADPTGPGAPDRP